MIVKMVNSRIKPHFLRVLLCANQARLYFIDELGFSLTKLGSLVTCQQGIRDASEQCNSELH